jgi:hypothetical protein
MEESGIDFRSETDTEVVLKGFGRSGARWREAITPWRGMFAFGLWNHDEGALSLGAGPSRDQATLLPTMERTSLSSARRLRALLASGLGSAAVVAALRSRAF